MPRLWLTRTQPFADESAARLRGMGYDVCVAPLIETVERPRPASLPAPEALLIFTSRKAVAVFAKLISDRLWECLCVGDATAEAARTAGFEQVHSAEGSADDVTAWIQHNINVERPLYHASSADPRGEIIERLTQAGFHQGHREIFYHSQPVKTDPRTLARVDDFILLYSPMAAKCLADLNLNLRKGNIFSMSLAIDEELGDIECAMRYVAEFPTENSLFTQLP